MVKARANQSEVKKPAQIRAGFLLRAPLVKMALTL